jgi:hypothetical protein
MPTKGNKALSGYRRRLNRNEVVRVEIHVRNDDARLRDRFGVGKAKGLKNCLQPPRLKASTSSATATMAGTSNFELADRYRPKRAQPIGTARVTAAWSG